MIRRARIGAFVLAAGMTIGLPMGAAEACACCGVAGTWLSESVAVDRIIAGVKGTGQQAGRVAVGGPGSRAEPEETRAVRLVSATTERLVLASANGTLIFRPTRARAVRQVEDISFAAGRDSAGGARLLHTYRVPGSVAAGGNLARLLGAGPAWGTLVVRGVGNACLEPGGMKMWLLVVRRGGKPIGHAAFPGAK